MALVKLLLLATVLAMTFAEDDVEFEDGMSIQANSPRAAIRVSRQKLYTCQCKFNSKTVCLCERNSKKDQAWKRSSTRIEASDESGQQAPPRAQREQSDPNRYRRSRIRRSTRWSSRLRASRTSRRFAVRRTTRVRRSHRLRRFRGRRVRARVRRSRRVRRFGGRRVRGRVRRSHRLRRFGGRRVRARVRRSRRLRGFGSRRGKMRKSKARRVGQYVGQRPIRLRGRRKVFRMVRKGPIRVGKVHMSLQHGHRWPSRFGKPGLSWRIVVHRNRNRSIGRRGSNGLRRWLSSRRLMTSSRRKRWYGKGGIKHKLRRIHLTLKTRLGLAFKKAPREQKDQEEHGD